LVLNHASGSETGLIFPILRTLSLSKLKEDSDLFEGLSSSKLKEDSDPFEGEALKEESWEE